VTQGDGTAVEVGLRGADARRLRLHPAVTLGQTASGRLAAKDAAFYIGAQLVGAAAAAAVLYVIASGTDGFDVDAGFAANGYGDHSPGGYSLAAGLVSIVLSAVFLIVIMGATDKRAPAGIARAAIGLASRSFISSAFLSPILR
jgi:aquaporin Z